MRKLKFKLTFSFRPRLGCKGLKKIVRSFLAAEAIAMLGGLEVTLYISELLKEMYKIYKIPIEV